MAASSGPIAPSPRRADAQIVRDLLKLQKAAQVITSVLDIDMLMEKIVHELTEVFGCREASVWLCDHARGELVLAGVRGCTVHSKGHRFQIGREGMVGWVAAHGRSRYAPDVTRDPYYVCCEAETRSEVVVPLRVGDDLIGVFVADHPELDGFSPWQLQLLEGLAQQVAIAVGNARRFGREQSANAAGAREAAEARIVQQALFPRSSPYAPGFSVEGESLPAGALGGDWYDFIPLSDGKWGIALADVAGKGMAAALLMSATRAALRSMADTCAGPGGVLQRLNRQLMADLPSGRFVTMVFGVFDPATRRVSFANAGHPWPIHVHGAHAQALATQRGLPLGIVEGPYSVVEVELAPGSRLLFYSDGITECADPQDEEYGVERLQRRLLQPGVSAGGLLADVRAFAGARGPLDDATVILLSAR